MVKNEEMPFDGTPSEKNGDGTEETIVDDPPDQAERRRSRKGVAMAIETERVDVEGIIDHFDHEDND